MYIKRYFGIIAALAAALLFSCGKEEKPAAFDVRLDIPSSVELDENTATLSFAVLDGKAPKATDAIVLSGYSGQLVCVIRSVSSGEVVVALANGWTEGTYSVSVQRGAEVLKQGSVSISVRKVDDGVNPAAGSTVYGRVSCGGEGVAGVVVSDGVEVVQTGADGVYQMSSSKYHKYVFLSLPSGYGAVSDGIRPVIHKPLTLRASAPERVDFELRKVSGQENHTMLVFGDMHLANRNGDLQQFSRFVSDVNAFVSSNSGLVYGLTLGDMTWDQFWLDKDHPYGFSDYLNDSKALRGLQVFHSIGNHDHSMYYAGDFDTVVEYKSMVAPTYYSFNIGKVHYIVLDDIECTNTGEGTSDSRSYNSNIVSDQLEWLRRDLSFVSKDRPLVISMHAPMYKNPGAAKGNSAYNLKNGSAAALEDAIRGYAEVHLLTGHTHKMYNVDNLDTDRVYEHNAGAVCATWWWSAKETPGIHLSQDGTPGGYLVFKVSGGEFSWQYKATGMPIDYQFRTYDRNQMEVTAEKWVPKVSEEKTATFNTYNGTWKAASTDNYVYLNVWDYDPSWTIDITENGVKLDVVRLGVTYDPLHLVAYTAVRLGNDNSTSFATSGTYHMFRVKASAPDTTLEIKVKDRFGNVYTESMKRPKPFTIDNYKVQALL